MRRERRRKQRRRVLATVTQLATALSEIPQPVVLLRSVRDGSGAITDFQWIFLNEAAAAAIPKSGDLVGGRLLDLVPDHPRDLFDAYVRVAETGKPATFDRVSYNAGWGRSPHDEARDVTVRVTKVDDGLALLWTELAAPATG